LLKDQKIKNDVQYQEVREKILVEYGITEEELVEDKDLSKDKNKGILTNELDDLDDTVDDVSGMEDYYSNLLEESKLFPIL